MLSLNSLLKSQMQMSTRQYAEMFPPNNSLLYQRFNKYCCPGKEDGT